VKPSNRPGEWRENSHQIDTAIQRHLNKLLRIAVAITGSKAEAEDIVQDAFLRLYQHQPSLESAAHETAWLIRVTVNLCKNRLRSHWWRTSVPLLDTHPAQNENQQDVMEIVMSLPKKYRAAIHLYYYEGYSTKEIADITAQSETAVRKQLSRARKMLKDMLEDGLLSVEN